MKSLTFNAEKLSHNIKINQENAFLKINRFFIQDYQFDNDYPHGMSIEMMEYNTDIRQQQHIPIAPSVNQKDGIFRIDRTIIPNNNTPNITEIKFYFQDGEIKDHTIELYYEIENLEIPLDKPWKEFKEHFEEANNAKILFSAPFGQGKTTFLKEFFRQENEKKNNCEVFHLFPVNYVVANNEDIFRLIKTEILVKLLKNEFVEFQKENFSYLQTLPHFALKNVHKILAPFLKAIPAVGESAFGIYEKLEELVQKYFSEHDELQTDDRKTAEQYIQAAYEDEGSIFEDNFYSQLIRQLIQQLKDQGKKTVLIIDDTDRMDPEHIFRILNVFAAHFDAPEYHEGDSNKFGFDKIIIVCDYDNLHKIFCHKYGSTTDFAGYIDKFFSKKIFLFDNTNAIKDYIKTVLPDERLQYKHSFDFLINDMVKTNSVSLREILKKKKINNRHFMPILTQISETINNTYLNGFFPVIDILLHFYNTKVLIERLKQTQERIASFDQRREEEYNSKAKFLISEIVLSNNFANEYIQKETFILELNELKYQIKLEFISNSGYYRSFYYPKMIKLLVDEILQQESNIDDKSGYKNFGAKEFYDLMILAVQKFNELKIRFD